MYVAKFHTQVLAQRHIPIRMNNQFAEYALTPQFQMAVSPLLIQCDKIKIFFRLMNVVWNALQVVCLICAKQIGRGVEEVHRAINADAYIYLIFPRHTNNIVHILEGVPWREAEHQRNGDLIFQGLNHLYHLVMAIASSHYLVCISVAIQRHIQMPGIVSTRSVNDLLWIEAIR